MSHFSISTRALIVTFVACGPADARPLHVRDSTPAAEMIVDGRNDAVCRPLRRVDRSRGLPDGHHPKWKGRRSARSNPGQ